MVVGYHHFRNHPYRAFRLIFLKEQFDNPNLLPTQVLSRSLWLWCCLVEFVVKFTVPQTEKKTTPPTTPARFGQLCSPWRIRVNGQMEVSWICWNMYLGPKKNTEGLGQVD